MFNSIVIDVAIGTVFSFLGVSLLTSAIVEAINSVFKVRSATLFAGVKGLLNDPSFTGLAKELYAHAAVYPRAGEGATRKPAYIDKAQFAAALMDVTGLSTGSVTGTGSAAVRDLQAAVETKVGTNSKIKTFLNGVIVRTNGDIKEIQTELADWFDAAMDRVSGDFKRQTQLIGFLIALSLAVIFNVDTFQLAHQLWKQPAIAEHLKLPASLPAPTKSSENPFQQAEQDQQMAADLVSTYLDNGLPIGWKSGEFFKIANPDPNASPDMKLVHFWCVPTWWAAIPGWLVTAIATLFGAPFWFDALQSFVRLKGSGPSPAEKQQQRGAAA